MKLNSVFFVVLFSLACISLNAQVFTGGNLGFNRTADKTEDGGATITQSSNTSFGFSPVAGKFLSEKFAVGVALDLTLSGSTNGVVIETKTTTTSLGGSLFSRYYAITWNKFSLFGQGDIGMAFSGSHTKTGGVTTSGPTNTRMYLRVYPGLSYDIDDHLSLQTTLNMLSLSYTYTIYKTGTIKENISNFSMGAGLNNIVSVGAITVGAIYKF